MKAFISDLDTKLRRFGVHPQFFGQLRELVEEGKQPSRELTNRLRHVENYKACLDSLLAELSQPVIQRHFPPPVSHFVSLEIP